MALVELCGLQSKVNITPCLQDDELSQQFQAQLNVSNPLQFCLPPGNVSTKYIVIFKSKTLLNFTD